MRTFTSTQPARVLGIVAFGLLACMYFTPKVRAQNVGIGTAAPASRLHVTVGTADATGLMVSGTQNAAGTFPDVGATTALIWIPRKSAFRVGTTTNTQWDNANVGRFSAAMGYAATASGAYTFAAGYLPVAQYTASVAIGYQPQALGSNSVAVGRGVEAASYSETALGAFNTLYTPADAFAWNTTDRLLVVGNGNSAAGRSDALVILKNGNTGIGTATPAARLHVAGTLRVGAYTLPATDGTTGQVLRTNGAGALAWEASASDLHSAYIAGPSITTNATQGPVEIAGNQGLVVHGQINTGALGVPASLPLANSVMCFIPGRAAFRGGFRQAVTDWDAANIGSYSFAYGYGAQAIGTYSVASGFSSVADGVAAFATGYSAQAVGAYTIAMGYNAQATNTNAIALGNNCLSSGLYGFSAGLVAVASGENSIAVGFRDTAQGDNSVAIGYYQKASGEGSVAIGERNRVTNFHTYAIGNNNDVNGNGSIAIGGYGIIEGVNSRTLGWSLVAPGAMETVLGNYNTDYVPTGTINDRLFCIGSGANNATRANAMVILKSERVGLGVNTPAYRLDLPNFASSLGQGRANAWLTYSDGRVKTGNRPIPYGLQTVMALRPQQYEHHSSTFENGQLVLDAAGPAATRIGFVAQDLARVVPEAATAPADAKTDLWAVDYTALVPVLVRALQEQQAQIEALQATVNQQATQLQHLSAQRP